MAPTDQTIQAAIDRAGDARNEVGRWLLRELHGLFVAFYRDSNQLEDLLQQSMTEVWASAARKAPRDAEGFLSWVVGVSIVTAKATRRLAGRDRARGAKLVLLPPPPRPRSPDSEIEWKSIEACVEQLSTPYRDAVIDRLNGHTPARLAAERGVSEATIRWRYNEAVRQIKQMLEHQAGTKKPPNS